MQVSSTLVRTLARGSSVLIAVAVAGASAARSGEHATGRRGVPAAGGAVLASSESPEGDLFDLSLEELADTRVVSVTGTERDWFGTPAAITVISGEELRRSGHRTLMEALRMVPGVHVGRIDSRQWALGVRGFSDLFTNKLQVVIDGRLAFNELFNGVFWDVQQPFLEDIERIEIIRGPGATLWGANAMNGVVNVITKSAHETRGLFASAGAGTEERGFGELRYGGGFGETGSYRVWGHFVDRDESIRIRDGSHRDDDWSVGRGGLRLDFDPLPEWRATVVAEGHGSEDIGANIPNADGSVSSGDGRAVGAHALLRLEQAGDEGPVWQFQGYYDFARRNNLNKAVNARHTVDLDLKRFLPEWRSHRIVLGLGYRLRRTGTTESGSIRYEPESQTNQLVTGFIQDTIELIDDRVFLMIGSKLEHNEFTGFEIQPSSRLWWTPTSTLTLWGAISRPVRRPSIIERDISFTFPSPPFPAGTELVGRDDLRSEELLAYEVGARARLSRALVFDVAAFYHDYEDVIVSPLPSGGTLFFTNAAAVHSWGFEVEAIWDPLRFLHLEASYGFIEVDARRDGLLDYQKRSPQNQAQLRATLDVGKQVELDGALYYTDRIESFIGSGGPIDDYFRLDLGLTWSPKPCLALRIVGQNLTEDEHAEFFQNSRVDAIAGIERSVYASISLRCGGASE